MRSRSIHAVQLTQIQSARLGAQKVPHFAMARQCYLTTISTYRSGARSLEMLKECPRSRRVRERPRDDILPPTQPLNADLKKKKKKPTEPPTRRPPVHRRLKWTTCPILFIPTLTANRCCILCSLVTASLQQLRNTPAHKYPICIAFAVVSRDTSEVANFAVLVRHLFRIDVQRCVCGTHLYAQNPRLIPLSNCPQIR
jgi:hypothetical protein